MTSGVYGVKTLWQALPPEFRRRNYRKTPKSRGRSDLQKTKPMNKKNLIKAALIGLPLVIASNAHAAYTDVDAVVSAVNNIPGTATTAFLAAASLGVAFLIVRIVGKALKRGVNVG